MSNPLNTKCDCCGDFFEREDTVIVADGSRVCTACLDEHYASDPDNHNDADDDREHDEKCALGVI